MNRLLHRTMMAIALCSLAGYAQAPHRTLRPQQAKVKPDGDVARVALVIGNAAYHDSPLKNPVNDARAVAAKLKQLGFDVVLRENMAQRQIGSTLREFRSRLSAGAEAVFFYAGHGLQVSGINYLPAVDADISAEEDVPTQSIDVNKVLELMDAQKTRLNLVFLDACRNNPYTRGFRAAGGGLAKISPPSGTIISYATRPGSVAADGTGSHGLYTEYLLQAMDKKDIVIEQALKSVFAGVKKASNGKQEPWQEGGVEGDFYFRLDQGGSPVPQIATAATEPVLPAPPVATAQVGGLQIMVNAPGAKVFVDGELKGKAGPKTPLNVKDLPVGKVSVRVDAPGYESKTESLDVDKGKWTQAEVVLSRSVVDHQPTVSSVPSRSDVQERSEMTVDLGNGQQMILLQIPAGTFRMGSASGSDDEKPVHVVTITRGFWMGKFDVTQAQWKAVMGNDPSHFKGDDLPVEQVSWNDCQEFLSRLNSKGQATFRLPTEAEWEYACRAGSTGERYGDLDAIAWYSRNSGSTTHPVGQKQPNAWGLCDMNGNVWQWCQDRYDSTYYGISPAVDPQGSSNGSSRVYRGGSWFYNATYVRSAARNYYTPDIRSNSLGFRVVAVARTQ